MGRSYCVTKTGKLGREDGQERREDLDQGRDVDLLGRLFGLCLPHNRGANDVPPVLDRDEGSHVGDHVHDGAAHRLATRSCQST